MVDHVPLRPIEPDPRPDDLDDVLYVERRVAPDLDGECLDRPERGEPGGSASAAACSSDVASAVVIFDVVVG